MNVIHVFLSHMACSGKVSNVPRFVTWSDGKNNLYRAFMHF